MFLVLLVHYVPTRGGVSAEALRHDTLATLCTMQLHSIAIVCTHCFVLISGYFGIRLSIKSFANLLYQMLFWSGASVLTAFAIGLDSSVALFLKGIIWGWFPWAYIVLMILSPMINAFIEKCGTHGLGRYIIVFYLLSTIGGYLMGCRDFLSGMSGLSLIGLYLTGAYLRKCKFKPFQHTSKVNFAIYLILGLALLVINVLQLLTDINSSPYGYLNPVVIVMAIYLFLTFTRMDIGSRSLVNGVAASAFSVYLFHCHPAIGGWISQGWTRINEACDPYLAIPVAVVSFIAIFAFCCAVDRLRIYSFKIIINKVFNNGKS